jgi:hypothetical protein
MRDTSPHGLPRCCRTRPDAGVASADAGVACGEAGGVGSNRAGGAKNNESRGGGTPMKPFICMSLLLAVALPAQGRETSREFRIGAVVLPRASVESVGFPARLELTDADVTRGYKELTATCRVRANDQRGYLLTLTPRTGLTGRIEVGGLNAYIVLGRDAVTVHRPRVGPVEMVALAIRVVLTAEAEAGSYPLPIQVDVSPVGAVNID